MSHDRHFIDGCVDHILSINRSDITVQSGNFSSWMENFERQQQHEQARSEHLQREVKHLKRAAERSASWSDKAETSKFGNGPVDRGFLGHKAAKMMKRSKTIEARQQQAIEEKSRLLQNTEDAENLQMFPLTYRSDLLVEFSDVAIAYDGRQVCGPISFEVRRGERVVLDGKNGSGKSSLLAALLGANLGYSGKITIASGLVISYVSQDTSHLKGILRDFADKNGLDESLFKSILRKLGFERAQFDKDIRDFSGGQKKKVLIAKSLCEQAHLYVWDEPLNFIDVYSRMQIEELIREAAPTMILVEHDKSFREAIATKTVKLG